jgi:hypothetical protein
MILEDWFIAIRKRRMMFTMDLQAEACMKDGFAILLGAVVYVNTSREGEAEGEAPTLIPSYSCVVFLVHCIKWKYLIKYCKTLIAKQVKVAESEEIPMS